MAPKAEKSAGDKSAGKKRASSGHVKAAFRVFEAGWKAAQSTVQKRQKKRAKKQASQ